MRRFDTFPFAGSETELLLLECRCVELYDHVDGFVIVEATVDHQGKSKPLNYREHEDQFAPWKDKITYVVADDLPTAEEFPHLKNPWQREHAQREHIARGLELLGAEDDDVIFQSDADEIPSVLQVRNITPRGMALVTTAQRGHFWAIDWLYDQTWGGTVAARYGAIKTLANNRAGGPFAAMRDARNSSEGVAGGWHFSWLGGTQEAWMRKVHSFCHPEVEDRIVENAEKYFREGLHVDGHQMFPVEVDKTYPKWMQDPANVPDSWRRPR